MIAKKVLLCFLFCILPLSTWGLDLQHSKWDRVLKKYLDANGLVKYKKLKEDLGTQKNHDFSEYLLEIQAVKIQEYEKLSKEDKMAFLINSYNALTFQLILDHYPIKSIKKIGGFFKKPWSIEFFSLLEGKIKSLDPIEHDWLRPHFKDYRIHAAVNCASISCPPLRGEAFVGSNLDKQLDNQMLHWLEDTKRNQIQTKTLKFKISKIFDWYEKDFVNWGGGVVSVINKYLKKSLGADEIEKVDIDYMNYNWNLNEAK